MVSQLEIWTFIPTHLKSDNIHRWNLVCAILLTF
jgi:hypothetical protein